MAFLLTPVSTLHSKALCSTIINALVIFALLFPLAETQFHLKGPCCTLLAQVTHVRRAVGSLRGYVKMIVDSMRKLDHE